MADDRSAMAELRTILLSREPLYSRASAVVDTAGLTVDAAAARLIDAVAPVLHSEARCSLGGDWSRVPDAVQRLFGVAPQSRDPLIANMDPGSAAPHAAKRGALRSIRGTRTAGRDDEVWVEWLVARAEKDAPP